MLVAQALAAYSRSRPDGWEIAEAESVFGVVLLRQSRLAEAEVCLRKSAERIQTIRGETSIYAARARRRLAELEEILRRRQGRPHRPATVTTGSEGRKVQSLD